MPLTPLLPTVSFRLKCITFLHDVLGYSFTQVQPGSESACSLAFSFRLRLAA
jgi:hypothetical protein